MLALSLRADDLQRTRRAGMLCESANRPDSPVYSLFGRSQRIPTRAMSCAWGVGAWRGAAATHVREVGGPAAETRARRRRTADSAAPRARADAAGGLLGHLAPKSKRPQRQRHEAAARVEAVAFSGACSNKQGSSATQDAAAARAREPLEPLLRTGAER